MNITITLNAEQQGALDDLVAAYNANRDEPVTATAYLQTVLLDIVDNRVRRNYDDAVERLKAAAKTLPYEQRNSLIAQVESAVGL